MSLTDVQVDALLQPIAAARVSRDGKGFSHVEAYDIRRRLDNIFGIAAWDGETLAMELVFSDETPPTEAKGKSRWTVAYKAHYALSIHATGAVYSEWAVGDAANQPSRADAHDLAMKMAESQALKRAASNLGDQFGLSLYNKGSMDPLVRYVLGDSPAALTSEQVRGAYAVERPERVLGPPNVDGSVPTETTPPDVADHVTEPLASENSPPPEPGEGPGAGSEDAVAMAAEAMQANGDRPKLTKLLLRAHKARLAGTVVTKDGLTLEQFIAAESKTKVAS